jgi:RNA recognition motif-containing protein
VRDIKFQVIFVTKNSHKLLEPHDRGKNSGFHSNKKYKIQKGHVMVFAFKYFNSKHKQISQLNILVVSFFDWPIIRISYQSL